MGFAEDLGQSLTKLHLYIQETFKLYSHTFVYLQTFSTKMDFRFSFQLQKGYRRVLKEDSNCAADSF